MWGRISSCGRFLIGPASEARPALWQVQSLAGGGLKTRRRMKSCPTMLLLAFKLNGVDGSLIHSTRFVLVDRRMRVRGYYITSDEGAMPQLLRDIQQLEREPW